MVKKFKASKRVFLRWCPTWLVLVGINVVQNVLMHCERAGDSTPSLIVQQLHHKMAVIRLRRQVLICALMQFLPFQAQSDQRSIET